MAWNFRSLLFLPMLQERFLAKAHERGADALILDLEDAVAPDRKAEARAAVLATAARLAPHKLPVLVRINHDAALTEADINASVGADVFALILPKVDTVVQLAEMERMVALAEHKAGLTAGHTQLCALIESPLGAQNAFAIATSSKRLQAFGFGGEDYATALGLPPSSEALRFGAHMASLAAHAAGIQMLGLAGSIAGFSDQDAFRALVALSKDYGFTGSMCIHPAQVAMLNEGFGVPAAEAALAQEIVTAYEAALAAGQGAIQLHGKMIDIPVYQRALKVLERAKR